MCRCQHQSWSHLKVTFPARRNPCGVCTNCGREKQGPGKVCCRDPKRCGCEDFQAEAVAS